MDLVHEDQSKNCNGETSIDQRIPNLDSDESLPPKLVSLFLLLFFVLCASLFFYTLRVCYTLSLSVTMYSLTGDPYFYSKFALRHSSSHIMP